MFGLNDPPKARLTGLTALATSGIEAIDKVIARRNRKHNISIAKHLGEGIFQLSRRLAAQLNREGLESLAHDVEMCQAAAKDIKVHLKDDNVSSEDTLKSVRVAFGVVLSRSKKGLAALRKQEQETSLRAAA